MSPLTLSLPNVIIEIVHARKRLDDLAARSVAPLVSADRGASSENGQNDERRNRCCLFEMGSSTISGAGFTDPNPAGYGLDQKQRRDMGVCLLDAGGVREPIAFPGLLPSAPSLQNFVFVIIATRAYASGPIIYFWALSKTTTKTAFKKAGRGLTEFPTGLIAFTVTNSPLTILFFMYSKTVNAIGHAELVDDFSVKITKRPAHSVGLTSPRRSGRTPPFFPARGAQKETR